MEDICGIYSLTNVYDGKRYIGQSKNIQSRYRSHINDLVAGRHRNQHLQSSFDKYALIFDYVFDLEVVEKCDVELLDEREVFWIKFYSTMDDCNGYNFKSGGNANSFYSEESRERMSKAQKGRRPPDAAIDASRTRLLGLWQQEEYRNQMSTMNKGENNPMFGMAGELCPFFGRQHKESSKQLVRDYKTEWWNEHRSHFDGESNPFYGKTHSDSTKRAISEKNKATWSNPEYRRKFCRPIVQFDLDDNYLKRYDSTQDANASINSISAINIAMKKCAYGKCICKGYKWMYESDYLAMIGSTKPDKEVEIHQ